MEWILGQHICSPLVAGKSHVSWSIEEKHCGVCLCVFLGREWCYFLDRHIYNWIVIGFFSSILMFWIVILLGLCAQHGPHSAYKWIELKNLKLDLYNFVILDEIIHVLSRNLQIFRYVINQSKFYYVSLHFYINFCHFYLNADIISRIVDKTLKKNWRRQILRCHISTMKNY